MYPGWPSLCLYVKDLGRATRFYEALGMEPLQEVSAPGMRAILRAGPFRLGLFAGIDGQNVMNFRGADVRALHERVKERVPAVSGTPHDYRPDERNRADVAGCSWHTTDPDGNAILFDTNEREVGESFRKRRIADLLRDTEQELAALDAGAELLETFRRELIDRFCSDG